MSVVRELLNALAAHGEQIGDPALTLIVERSGRVVWRSTGDLAWVPGVVGAPAQGVMPEVLDVFAEYRADKDGLVGPDLRRPREHLRIIPGKVSGEPHVDGSRVTTRAIAALAEIGYSTERIQGMFPQLDSQAITEAWDLERQLQARSAA